MGFAFKITAGTMLTGIAFAAVMGLVGGFFPARQAAKQNLARGLRGG